MHFFTIVQIENSAGRQVRISIDKTAAAFSMLTPTDSTGIGAQSSPCEKASAIMNKKGEHWAKHNVEKKERSFHLLLLCCLHAERWIQHKCTHHHSLICLYISTNARGKV